MSKFKPSEIGSSVERYFRMQGNLVGKVVVHLPAGEGRMSRTLHELGATAEPYDLYPEFFKAEGLVCQPADLERDLPIPTRHSSKQIQQVLTAARSILSAAGPDQPASTRVVRQETFLRTGKGTGVGDAHAAFFIHTVPTRKGVDED